MIVAYSSDEKLRESSVRCWEAAGIECTAAAPVEFLSWIGDPSLRAVVMIGPCCAGIGASIPSHVALFTVGGEAVGNSSVFPAPDSPELIRSLLRISDSIFNFSYGNLLWSDEHTTYLLGYALPLRPAERVILSYLVRSAGRAVPPGELLQTCFPTRSPSEDRAARVIRTINRKAAEIGGRTLIVCDHDGAYRLREYF